MNNTVYECTKCGRISISEEQPDGSFSMSYLCNCPIQYLKAVKASHRGESLYKFIDCNDPSVVEQIVNDRF